jgi:ribosomal protein L7/L12
MPGPQTPGHHGSSLNEREKSMFEGIKDLGCVRAFEVHGRFIAIKNHHMEVLADLVRSGSNVAGIKFIKAEYEMGLKDAKDTFDAIAEPIRAFNRP